MKAHIFYPLILACTLTPCITLTISLFETGIEYQENKQFNDAIVCYEKALQDEPNNLTILFRLGCCYLLICEKDKAINAFDKIIQRIPHQLDALYNKAYTYKTFGDFDKAIEIYHKILAIDPHNTMACHALSIAYVMQGNFELGWKYHEKVVTGHELCGDRLRSLLRNNDIANKKIVLYGVVPKTIVHGAIAFGDIFHFVRYAERLKEMGAYVTVVAQKSLLPLLSRCTYIDQLISDETPTGNYDAATTFMNIAPVFANNEMTAPNNIPYIFADPDLVTHWQQKLAHDKNFKVGICWQSTLCKTAPVLTHRGCPLEKFTRLANVDGVSFYSLQKCNGMEQLATLSSDFPLQIFDNLDEEAGPFMDTAALIKNLDLIISVDTSIVHLAGALGATVWMVHPYSTDWRWIHNRPDSYWYPAMRIFKQQEPFNWDGVMETVANELQKLVAQQ